MNRNQLKSVGISTGLIVTNVALIGILGLTKISEVTGILFQTPIIGMLVFGAALFIGRILAERGIERNRTGLAVGGTAILQVTYGIFGGGVISVLPTNLYPLALGATALLTTVVTLLATALVYGSGRNFRKWRTYSNYIFMAALGTGLAATFIPGFLLLTFLLVLAGFLTYLIYEIWKLEEKPENVLLNGIGIYVALMGVFVQLLQIVVEILYEK